MNKRLDEKTREGRRVHAKVSKFKLQGRETWQGPKGARDEEVREARQDTTEMCI